MFKISHEQVKLAFNKKQQNYATLSTFLGTTSDAGGGLCELCFDGSLSSPCSQLVMSELRNAQQKLIRWLSSME